MKEVNTLIISDLHIGNKNCQSKSIVKLLQTIKFKRLIINGDGFDSHNLQTIKKHSQFKIINQINKFVSEDKKNKVEVIWVKGNHDGWLLDVISKIFGFKVYDEYTFTINNKIFLVMHGHIFDFYIMNSPKLTKICCMIYDIFQKIEGRHQNFSKILRRMAKKWLNVSWSISGKASNYAYNKYKNKKICVILGHTHEYFDNEINGIRVMNCGCWIDIPAHYITIDDYGKAELHEFKKGKN